MPVAKLYDNVDMRGERPLVNGKSLPEGVTMQDWIRLHYSPDFYNWLNGIRHCHHRLDRAHGWCGV